MNKWHAHVAHMAKHMNMVGALGPGPLPPPKSGAEAIVLTKKAQKRYTEPVRTQNGSPP